ncbi:hypothetical protein [Deminuibacter soli]|uniref:HEPN domain-containing protein n=1 Tax=Deminuibacter soli TaxID=2291815 RepID=A0A3E1NGS9_9BACT|nr:hypothetical protein [Deminuibacter soli]RFM26998.1 hypothetical protein DXN05_16075 [Deminuibacter soli]
MIAKNDLRTLVKNRLKDTKVLLENRRYSTAKYMAGYSIEIALKLKICYIFKFKHGYPENDIEFAAYKTSPISSALFKTTVNKIQQLKNHDLSRLLKYSGEEYTITTSFVREWNDVLSWDPINRYSTRIVRKREAVRFITNCNTILANLNY